MIRTGKSRIVHDSDCKQKVATLYRYFPKTNELYEADIIITELLQIFDVTSLEWKIQVTAISRFEHGPCIETIHANIGYSDYRLSAFR